MSFLPAELIKNKRHGLAHTREELNFFMQGYVAGKIPDYQIAAWLMAIYFRGMTEQETAWLTEIMMHSGRVLKFREEGIFAVDKHSTGGVGDKTSLILAPLVAAAGATVPMMAGRGLGHTGGTLDKLESIEGFNVRLDLERFTEIVKSNGTAIIGQTKDICPADLKLYSLRDVTATVESIPLICASIMSKKLAEGLSGLVLDVKFGSGAFMKTAADAEALAKALTRIGTLNGVHVVALLTNMEQPLGRFVGNACEVHECLEILNGRTLVENGVDFYEETRELSLELASQMLVVAKASPDLATARQLATKTLASGAALRKFHQICEAQGAKASWQLPTATHSQNIASPASGFVEAFDTEAIGFAGIELGAGRKKSEDSIDHVAGIEILLKRGQKVAAHQPVFRIFGRDSKNFNEASRRLQSAFRVSPSAPAPSPLIHATVTHEGVRYAHEC